MRVLHVIKGVGAGGAERLLVSLASARSPGVEVEVAYVLPWKDALVDELRAAGAAVHLLGGRRGLADPRWLWRLRHVVRDRRPEVVHLHSPAVAASARAMLHMLRPRPVVVSTEHNVWDAFGALTRMTNSVTLPLGDATLAVSEEVRASTGRHHRAVDVLVQGVPVDEIAARRTERPAARARLGARPDDVVVAMVANFREKKDHGTFLHAAAACADDPRLRFVSIGQGPLEGEVHDLHRDLGLGERLRFLGFQPDPIALLAGVDVFTLTSRHEGLPISLLESMALGITPVVSAVGGIPAVVTDGVNGALVAAGDVAGFAAAYRDLARDATRRDRLGWQAALRARDFDIRETQRALEARYEALLAERAR